MNPPIYFEYWVSNEVSFSKGDKSNSRYSEEFHRCKNAILAEFPGMNIFSNTNFNKVRGEGGNSVYPREGAFEIYLGKSLIFSKLKRNEWPELKKLVKKIKKVMKMRISQKQRTTQPKRNTIKIYANAGKKNSLIPRKQKKSSKKVLQPIKLKIPGKSDIQKQDTINMTTFSQSRNNLSNNETMNSPNSVLLDNWLNDVTPQKNNSYDSNQQIANFNDDELKDRNITRNFEIMLDCTAYTNKKLTYENKSDCDCTYTLRSSSKFMRTMANTVTIESHKRQPFKLLFLPVHAPMRQIYHLLVDLDGKFQETIQITANYI